MRPTVRFRAALQGKFSDVPKSMRYHGAKAVRMLTEREADELRAAARPHTPNRSIPLAEKPRG